MLVRVSSTVLSVALIAAILVTATTGTAHAYVDIGTGSMILQVLAAGFFGGLFTLKVFWRRITGKLSTVLTKIKTRETPQL